MRSSCKQLLKGGIYNYFHSLLPPLSLAPFMPRTPLYSISLFCKGLSMCIITILRKAI
ncbi:DNA methylase [Porphyromonas gingivalis]|nr:DNA methylase [Porphyromonas gingivalis]